MKPNVESVWVHPLEKSSNGWCSGGCWSPSLEPMVLDDDSPKTFLFQTITLEASQGKKKVKIETLWLFVHTKTLGHGLLHGIPR